MKNLLKNTAKKAQQKTLIFLADNSGSEVVEKLGMIALAAGVVGILIIAFKTGAGATAINTWITTVISKVTTAIG